MQTPIPIPKIRPKMLSRARWGAANREKKKNRKKIQYKGFHKIPEGGGGNGEVGGEERRTFCLAFSRARSRGTNREEKKHTRGIGGRVGK